MGTCPDCDGASFRQRHQISYWSAYLALLAASLLILNPKLGDLFRSRAQARHTLFVAACCYYVLLPLTYTGADWHGEILLFHSLFAGLIGFPTSLLALPLTTLIPNQNYPYYDSDFTYGLFSAYLSLNYLLLVATAYVQWFIALPALRRRLSKGQASDTDANA